MATALPEGWESDYDGQRWYYRYKPSGVIQYHFPRPGDEFPDWLDSWNFTPPPDLSPEEKIESQRQLKRRDTTGAEVTLRGNRRESSGSNHTRASVQGGPSGRGRGDTASGAPRPLASATLTGNEEDGEFWFQPENFMYLGPGAYNDSSPDQGTDQGSPMRRRHSDTSRAGPRSPPISLISPTTTQASPSAYGTPQIANSEASRSSRGTPRLGLNTAIAEPSASFFGGDVVHSPGVPMLDGRAVFNPVGNVAELATAATRQSRPETGPPPVEMPANERQEQHPEPSAIPPEEAQPTAQQADPIELPNSPARMRPTRRATYADVEDKVLLPLPGLVGGRPGLHPRSITEQPTAQPTSLESVAELPAHDPVPRAELSSQPLTDPAPLTKKPTLPRNSTFKAYTPAAAIPEEADQPSSNAGGRSLAQSQEEELGYPNQRRSPINTANIPSSLQPAQTSPRQLEERPPAGVSSSAGQAPSRTRTINSPGDENVPQVLRPGFNHVPSSSYIKPPLRRPSQDPQQSHAAYNQSQADRPTSADAPVQPSSQASSVQPPAESAQQQVSAEPRRALVRTSTLPIDLPSLPFFGVVDQPPLPTQAPSVAAIPPDSRELRHQLASPPRPPKEPLDVNSVGYSGDRSRTEFRQGSAAELPVTSYESSQSREQGTIPTRAQRPSVSQQEGYNSRSGSLVSATFNNQNFADHHLYEAPGGSWPQSSAAPPPKPAYHDRLGSISSAASAPSPTTEAQSAAVNGTVSVSPESNNTPVTTPPAHQQTMPAVAGNAYGASIAGQNSPTKISAPGRMPVITPMAGDTPNPMAGIPAEIMNTGRAMHARRPTMPTNLAPVIQHRPTYSQPTSSFPAVNQQPNSFAPPVHTGPGNVTSPTDPSLMPVPLNVQASGRPGPGPGQPDQAQPPRPTPQSSYMASGALQGEPQQYPVGQPLTQQRSASQQAAPQQQAMLQQRPPPKTNAHSAQSMYEQPQRQQQQQQQQQRMPSSQFAPLPVQNMAARSAYNTQHAPPVLQPPSVQTVLSTSPSQSSGPTGGPLSSNPINPQSPTIGSLLQRQATLPAQASSNPNSGAPQTQAGSQPAQQQFPPALHQHGRFPANYAQQLNTQQLQQLQQQQQQQQQLRHQQQPPPSLPPLQLQTSHPAQNTASQQATTPLTPSRDKSWLSKMWKSDSVVRKASSATKLQRTGQAQAQGGQVYTTSQQPPPVPEQLRAQQAAYSQQAAGQGQFYGGQQQQQQVGAQAGWGQGGARPFRQDQPPPQQQQQQQFQQSQFQGRGPAAGAALPSISTNPKPVAINSPQSAARAESVQGEILSASSAGTPGSRAYIPSEEYDGSGWGDDWD